MYLSQHVATGVAATITDGSANDPSRRRREARDSFRRGQSRGAIDPRAAVAAAAALGAAAAVAVAARHRGPEDHVSSRLRDVFGGTDKTVVVYWTEAPSVTGARAATIDIGPYGLGHLLGTSRFDAGYGRAVLTGKAAKDVRDAGKVQLDPRNAFGGGPSATATVVNFDALVDPSVAADGGTMLEKCSAHAGCEGLAGDCCPNPAGDYLNCCSSPTKTAPSSSAPSCRRCERRRSTTRPPPPASPSPSPGGRLTTAARTAPPASSASRSP